MSTTAIAVSRPARAAGLRRWAAIASGTYVAAWVIGLAIAPAAPETSDSAATIHAHYADHAAAVMAQSLLVHGVAGVALVVLAVTAGHALVGDASRPAIAAAIGAALASFAQVGLALVATVDSSGASPATSLDRFDAINAADVVKLVFLAAFVALLTWNVHRLDPAARRYTTLGTVLAALLPIGATAFVVDNEALYLALTLSLFLLLAWVAATGVKAARPRLVPSSAA